MPKSFRSLRKFYGALYILDHNHLLFSSRQNATELKSEIRSSKSETNRSTQIQKSKSETSLFGIFYFLIIWICFEFRISSFELFLASHSLGAPFDFAQDMLCAVRRAHGRGLCADHSDFG